MHFASRYRWLVYNNLFEQPPSSATLLDIGSDDGGFIERLPVQTSVAIDRSRDALRQSQASLSVCADGTHLPFRTAQFDYVILSDVIEHVPDDTALIANATERVKPSGTLWLSTTASAFQLFPTFLTARAEQSWGHVRKGYTSERLTQLIGDEFECRVIVWPEIVFRHSYLIMRCCALFSQRLAGALATLCFIIDRRLRSAQLQQGHIYIQAVRHTGEA